MLKPVDVPDTASLAHVMDTPTLEHARCDPRLREERLAALFGWAEDGRVTPFVSHADSLAGFRQALRRKLAGGVVGGCALNP